MTLFYFRNRGCIELDGKRERDKWKAKDKETVVFWCTISYDRVFFFLVDGSRAYQETCTEKRRGKNRKKKTVDLNPAPYAPISLWSTVSPLNQQKNPSSYDSIVTLYLLLIWLFCR